MPAKRILVVDDEAIVLESLRITLAHYGYDVATAASGPEALVKLGLEEFELVVTDRKMPHMTGDQLAAFIKQQKPDLPVIMLTGFPPDRKPAAVDMILLKPFSTADLRAAIEGLLNGAPPPTGA
jgi:CheY-like chemotaxis protein